MKKQSTTSIPSFWALLSSAFWFLLLVPARAEKRAAEGSVVLELYGPGNITWPSLGRQTSENQFCLYAGQYVPTTRKYTYIAKLLNNEGQVIASSSSATVSTSADRQASSRYYIAGAGMMHTPQTPSIKVAFVEFFQNNFTVLNSEEQSDSDILKIGFSGSSYAMQNVQHTIDCNVPLRCAVIARYSRSDSIDLPRYFAAYESDIGNLERLTFLADGDVSPDLKCSTTECFVIHEDTTNNDLCVTKLVLPNTLLTANRFCFARNKIRPSITVYSNNELGVVAKSTDQALWYYKLATTGQALLVNGKLLVNATQAGVTREHLRIETNSNNDTVIAWDELATANSNNYFITLDNMGQIISAPLTISPTALTLDPQTTFTLMSGRRLLAAYRKELNLTEVRILPLPVILSTTTTSTTATQLTLPRVNETDIPSSRFFTTATGSRQSTTSSVVPTSLINETSAFLIDSSDQSTVVVVVREDNQTNMIIAIVVPVALVLLAGLGVAVVCVARKRRNEEMAVEALNNPVSIGSYAQNQAPGEYQVVRNHAQNHTYDDVGAVGARAANVYEQPDAHFGETRDDSTERRYPGLPIFHHRPAHAPHNPDYDQVPAIDEVKAAF